MLPDAITAYYQRIGADVLNFRTAMVRAYVGKYYHEKCLIRIAADGEVTVTLEQYAPTEEEAKAIKEAVIKSNWPKPVEASEAAFKKWLRNTGVDPKDVFAFYSDLTGDIIMLQERRTVPDGKAYIPHTLFDDGEWRPMEPGGKLPFWKPKFNPLRPTKLMIHEGAKAAHAAANVAADHPWYSELKQFEHWGAIGGALAPHRCNYDEIRRYRPTECVYVCDNDFPGKAAMKDISRNYGGSIKGVMFDKRWPLGWDMADPMPKTFWDAEGKYAGPELRHLFFAATYATEVVGKKTVIIKHDFAEEWFHCVQPEIFVHRDWPNRIWTGPEFNNSVRPYSGVDDTARLLKQESASKGVSLRYTPAATSGLYIEGDRMCINTHMPTLIRAEEGDIGPFLEYMERLCPEPKDREELWRWCATLIARPDIKMLYGCLLISEEQGVGKGTLGEKILAPLVGNDNTSFPSEEDIVESSFNYWSAHKRLAVVHEIYAGHSARAYNKLKSIITDRTINVNKKYQASYEIENWLHIFACSNSLRAIQLSADDRRWFVPKVTEQKVKPSYWISFNEWLNDRRGLRIIKWYANEWLKTNPSVMRGDNSPWSEAKREVIEEGFSPGMTLVSEILDRIAEEAGDRPVVIIDLDLIRLIREIIYEGRQNVDRLERPATIRKIAKLKKWHIGKEKIWKRKWGKSDVYGGRFITNQQEMINTSVADLSTKTDPMDVLEYARRTRSH